jgi:hypothetical protein
MLEARDRNGEIAYEFWKHSNYARQEKCDVRRTVIWLPV